MIMDFIREALALAKKRKAERVDREERATIAKHFNNRYTFRKRLVEGMPILTGTAMFGILPRNGYAWMCPECNRIHHPVECSFMSGLQYPACCKWPKGHRLDASIRTS